MNLLLSIAAVILAIMGIVSLINGAVLYGIILLIAAAVIGPGGYSIARTR